MERNSIPDFSFVHNSTDILIFVQLKFITIADFDPIKILLPNALYTSPLS